MKKLLLMMLVFLVLPLISAQITIDNVDANSVEPSGIIHLTLNLENNNEDYAEEVRVMLNLENLPFAPLGMSNEKVIDEIGEGDSESVKFELQVLASAESGTYKVPVSIIYGNSTDESIISLSVKSFVNLRASLEEAMLIQGREGTAKIRIVNTGYDDVSFLNIRVIGDSSAVTSGKEIYIGGLDSDDYELAEFSILSDKSFITLNLLLTYRDNSNKEYSSQESIGIRLYSTEEAYKLGLIKRNFTAVWVVIVLAVILFWFIRKRRKRKAG